ncbi:extracellular solute-binding protein [Paenibacillus sp. HWE-109]|uniref:extracellular solute-binding protein n=1 Tax=Paenibacillus sp. HWE-109 TaxID=1306526 RepID=UPI001EDE2B0A|nr:extracellular solute-binding protein [Paenibacillus sp. HWE-109]UKS29606.1 extracellular solute-binding protein [Paenibacillus sp. HWE-109]
MTTHLRKKGSLSLAVLLTVSLAAGCSTAKKEGDIQTSASPAGSSPPAAQTTEPAKQLDKNAKIRIAVPENAAFKGFDQGMSENKNPFLDALKEKTGYKNVEWTVIPAANQLDKLNLMFASGDTFDLIYNSDLSLYNRFVGQGMLLDLNDVIGRYGSEISKMVADSSWAAVTKGGNKYAIPVPPYQKYNDQNLGGGFLAREDWINKLGLQDPKNLDELYTFLKTLKEKDPSGKGTLPLTASGANRGNPFDGLDMITGAFGMSGITDLAVPFIVQDGKLVDSQDLYLKELLTYLNRLYKEGLLDNEFLFNKSAQVNEKVSAGKAAALYAGYYDVKNLSAALVKTDSGASFKFLAPVTGKDGRKGYPRPAPVSFFFMIPKNAKHPAEAIDLLNTYLKDKDLQNYINFGKEGTHYEMVNGNLSPIKPAYDQIIYKIYYRLWNSPDVWLPNAKLAGYEPDMIKYTAVGPHLIAPNINQYRPQTEVELSKGKTLIDLRYEYAAKIITGAFPLEALDEYFKKADAAGRKEVIQASQSWFQQEGQAIYSKLVQAK